jgi:hypothetical protein
VWGVQELEYLGHKISAAGMLPLPSHMAAIQDFPCPTIIKELQAFLGMVNFYRRFLPNIVRTLRPLTDGPCSGKKGADKLEWSAAMDTAFAGAKQALLSATHLAHTMVGAELSVVVDASATHVDACLQQHLPGQKDWQPLGFSLRSWRRPSRSTPPSTGSYSPVTPESGISGICWTPLVCNLHRPQAAHICCCEGVRPLDSTTIQAAVIHGRVHFRYPPHRRGSQRGG